MSDTKKCISCGAELDEKALFCPSCGAKQEEIKINKIQRKPRPKVKVDIDDETLKNIEKKSIEIITPPKIEVVEPIKIENSEEKETLTEDKKYIKNETEQPEQKKIEEKSEIK